VVSKKAKRIIRLTLKSIYTAGLIAFLILLIFSGARTAGYFLGKYLFFGFIFYMIWTFAGEVIASDL